MPAFARFVAKPVCGSVHGLRMLAMHGALVACDDEENTRCLWKMQAIDDKMTDSSDP